MKEENRRIRHEAIKGAAYSLLAQKGYDGASMLSIAKAAKASNETLYRWYGDKQGLFKRMVRDNSMDIKEILENAIEGQADPFNTLKEIAPIFLTMLLGDRAILLNRAAAADPTGELGAVISAGGRNVIQPLFESLIQNVAAEHKADAQQLTGCFLSLLVGDLQIKRVIGVEPMPTKTEIENRATLALHSFVKLLS